MAFSWVACKAKTGEVITEMPNLEIDMVRQSIGRYETSTATLPVDTKHAPNQWPRAVLEGASFFVLLWEAPDPSGEVISVPVWGALVTQSTPDQTDVVQITLATLESYLDRQYINSAKTYTNVDQNTIASDLITSFVGASVGGIPIRVQVVGGAGKVRTHVYADQDDKTVYSALQDLSGENGGPEWFIGWEHQTSPERYTPVFYVGSRVGTAAMAGMSPNAAFDMPGPVTAFQLTRDFSDGKGANVVMAYSSGQGSVRPQSPPQTFTDPERPKFEYRWTPSTSIIDVGTLTGYAAAAVAQMKAGAIALTMSANALDKGCPQLGVDWFLGDDVAFNIGGIVGGVDTVPSVPGGLNGTARAIGYTLTLADPPILTPVLAGAAII
ncbi:hypothetical protein ACFRFH_12155 [Leifsonia sp. NPDC056824]|uniref:hypothetical protein n=1 Tax=Leifsonia sp. NPDC056824 TaxID=3345953 RepID=UPI0036BC4B90